MKALEFYNHWIDHANILQEKDPEGFLGAYRGSNLWTRLIIGSKKDNSEKVYPFAKYLKSKSGLMYRPEEYSIDFVFTYGNHFKDIANVSSDHEELSFDQRFYPPVYDVIFEHENDIESCWKEMIKLTRFRAKLKVLVTYNWSPSHSRYEIIKKSTVTNFRNIIMQADKKFPENPDTEYLLIIGERNQENDKVNWGKVDLRGGKISYTNPYVFPPEIFNG
jgi:hypothetical protein